MKGEKEEKEAEKVLLFRDPRDAFDLNGMDREEQDGNPGQRGREPLQESEQEQRVKQVQREAESVVSPRVIAPELMLEPKSRKSERKRMRGSGGHIPEFQKARQRMDQRILRDVFAIIPNEAVVQGVAVDEHTQDQDPEYPEPIVRS